MIRWLALVLALAGSQALACPPPSEALLFHSCWGAAEAALHPLPGVLPRADGARRHLTVTGVYTGEGARPDGGPLPVGMFVHGGQVLNPNLGRMDGVLILPPGGGRPELHHRARVAFGGMRYDLRRLDERRAFQRAAAEGGAGVAQSHLLIVDGAPDVSPRAGAPRFRRRVLFTGPEGWGVWQSGEALTLYEATERLATARAPRMALNLDMGSFDYCWLRRDAGPPERCGLRARHDTAQLSNILSFTLR